MKSPFLKSIIYKLKDEDFIMGMIVFSPLSSFITIQLLHLPLSLPELLFIPFLNHFIRTWKPKDLKINLLIALSLIWMSVLAISFIYGEYSIKEILGCSRTYYYIIIFVSIFASESTVPYSKIFNLSSGAVFGWSIDAAYSFFNLIEGQISVSYGPMIAVPIVIGYTFFNKKQGTSLIYFITVVIIGIIGLLRRVILIAFVNYILSIIYYINNKHIHSGKFFLVISICIITISLGYSSFSESIRTYNYDMYVRIIAKSESFLNGEDNEGDTGRKDIQNEFFNSIQDYMFPRGFASKAYTNGGDGSLNDFPLKELAYTFGIPLTILMLIVITPKALTIYKKVKLGRIPEENLILCLGYITIIVLLGLEGSFLTFPYQSIYTGFYLGSLINNNIQRISLS